MTNHRLPDIRERVERGESIEAAAVAWLIKIYEQQVRENGELTTESWNLYREVLNLGGRLERQREITAAAVYAEQQAGIFFAERAKRHADDWRAA